MIRSKFVSLTLVALGASTANSAAPTSADVNNIEHRQHGMDGYGVVVNRVVIDPRDSNVLYAATALYSPAPEHGVFKSTDQGESWFAVNDGLTDLDAHTLAIDPQNPDTLYVGSNQDIFKTVNGGGLWSPTGELGIFQVHDIAIDPVDSNTIYAGGDSAEFFSYTKSTNGGLSWSPSRTVYPFGHVHAIAIDPRDSNVIYAGTYSGKTGHGEVMKSLDGGDHWSLAQGGLPDSPRDALLVDHQDSNIIYVANGVAHGIYKSTDAGGEWRPSLVDPDPASGLRADCLAMDPRDSNTVYAGTYAWRERGRIFKTTDGGDSWYEANKGIGTRTTQSIAIDPIDSKIVYAGTGDGIFKTIDGGESWFAIGPL